MQCANKGGSGHALRHGLIVRGNPFAIQSQGRPHVFCDMRIVNDAGLELPQDGTSVGHLQVGGSRLHSLNWRLQPDDV